MSIPITKEEMEDIWNNKPVKYLSMLKKERKGRKVFKVTIQGYEYKMHEPETFEILSKYKEDAKWTAQSMLRQKYPNIPFEGYKYKID